MGKLARKGVRNLTILGTKAGPEGVMDPVYGHLMQVIQNYSTDVRDELLTWAAHEIPERTRANIRRGYAESGYPIAFDRVRANPGRLGRSVKATYVRGAESVTVSYGKGIPYAWIHNLPEGEFVEIRGNLRFPNRRNTREWTRTTLVLKPGKAVFSRAIESVQKEMPVKADKIIKRLQRESAGSNVKYYSSGVKMKVATKRLPRKRR